MTEENTIDNASPHKIKKDHPKEWMKMMNNNEEDEYITLLSSVDIQKIRKKSKRIILNVGGRYV